jgi:hypothetical protein
MQWIILIIGMEIFIQYHWSSLVATYDDVTGEIEHVPYIIRDTLASWKPENLVYAFIS